MLNNTLATFSFKPGNIIFYRLYRMFFSGIVAGSIVVSLWGSAESYHCRFEGSMYTHDWRQRRTGRNFLHWGCWWPACRRHSRKAWRARWTTWPCRRAGRSFWPSRRCQAGVCHPWTCKRENRWKSKQNTVLNHRVATHWRVTSSYQVCREFYKYDFYKLHKLHTNVLCVYYVLKFNLRS